MDADKIVLCGSNAYEKKYYFNEKFGNIPEEVKKELQIMCVLFTEDVGGIFLLEYNESGNLDLQTMAEEGDLLFDEIGAELKIRKLRNEKRELLESLEAYYLVWREKDAFSH